MCARSCGTGVAGRNRRGRGIGRAISVALGALEREVVVTYNANEAAAAVAAAAVVATGGAALTQAVRRRGCVPSTRR